MDVNIWNHIIKYIEYPSKPLYKVIHNTNTYKQIYAKSILKIQRFYRQHRAQRHDNIDIKNISKKMLIRVYITQYPIKDIDNFVFMFNRKIRAFHQDDYEKLKKVSPLRRLQMCLNMHTTQEIHYANIYVFLY